MGTHLGFSAGTACGVDGQRELHERVAAVAEGVVLTRLNPRQLKKRQTDPEFTHWIKTTQAAIVWPNSSFREITC